MNIESQEELNNILQKNPESLSTNEIAFLRARSGYLNNEQKRIFASVLTVKKVVEAKPKAVVGRGKKKVEEVATPIEEVNPEDRVEEVTPIEN